MTFDLDDPSLLFTDAFIDDPAPVYAALRERAPVWEMPGTGSFVVASARLVAEAVGRPEDFSSNLTSLLYTGDDARPTVFDMTHLGRGTHVLATADPPVHTLHRRLLQPLFSPGAVETRAQSIDDAAAALVRSFVAQGGGNVATAVAEPLPVQVICSMIGIPDADVAVLEPLVLRSNDLLAGVVDAATMAHAGGAAMQVTQYLHGLVSGWQPAPGGTAVCDHLARVVAAGEVPIEDALGMVTQLLGAGTDTTTSLISRATLQLATDPALQQSLREHPDRIGAFLEEMLRYDGPFRFHYRAVRRDTELGGVRIPAGSRLLLLWASANLDADEFDHPDRFDVERAALRSHFAFGRGMHFCIGAPLARAEARAAVAQLLGQTRHVALTPGESPAWRRTIFVRRLAHLPLDVEPA
jgi:cytochrome P450